MKTANSELPLLKMCILHIHVALVAHLVIMTECLIINIFREDLFWFEGSQCILLGCHCDSRNVRQLVILHQQSGSTELNPAIQLPVSCLFSKESEPIGRYCPNSESVFPPQLTLSEMPSHTLPEVCLLADLQSRQADNKDAQSHRYT